MRALYILIRNGFNGDVFSPLLLPVSTLNRAIKSELRLWSFRNILKTHIKFYFFAIELCSCEEFPNGPFNRMIAVHDAVENHPQIEMESSIIPSVSLPQTTLSGRSYRAAFISRWREKFPPPPQWTLLNSSIVSTSQHKAIFYRQQQLLVRWLKHNSYWKLMSHLSSRPSNKSSSQDYMRQCVPDGVARCK